MRTEKERLKEYLQPILGRARESGPPPQHPLAQVACRAIASQFKTSTLSIASLAILFGLYILLTFIGGGVPTAISAGHALPPASAGEPVDAMAAERELPVPPDPSREEGESATGTWRDALKPVWTGTVAVALGYGQGLDWKWHEITLRKVLADPQGKLYLVGTALPGGEPRNFRLDKITRLRTEQGECSPHSLDGTREALLSAIGRGSM